jgi:hypothetical protein
MKTLVSRPKPVLGLCKTILGSGSREFPRLRFNAFEPGFNTIRAEQNG